ncbi:MAG: DUF1080 domain-containing protein [Bacteroidetes bacterium]|nr:DUF1080 domain-containing protein [Bacteroidota bacterium]
MTRHLTQTLAALCLAACTLFACTTKTPDNQLSEQEKSEGWSLLFDGQSTKGWHIYNNAKGPSTWSVSNGELVCGPDVRLVHLDLVSDGEYKNYDLRFDWKINKGGNSGVFINVVEKPDIPAAWASGPEYQMLDTSHPDFHLPTKRSGTLFALTAPLSPAETKPSPQWNQSRIVQRDGHIEFYLNGILTTKQDLTDPAWLDSVSKTYFNNFPSFGRQTSGHIGLQDWHKSIAFKNIKIRQL